MREMFLKSFLDLVEQFICPSNFLRDRYIAWGLPSEKLLVNENGQPEQPRVGSDETRDERLASRFVVLGQLSRRKGTLVLLDAIRLLPKKIRKQIRVEIHGSSQYAEDEFKTQFERAVAELDGTVTVCGPYVTHDVGAILRKNGWLIVPSIWWENSPTVIQESFSAGRPVICSDIGGMAEKVTHGVNGIHFRVNNAADLAARIEECSTSPVLWKQLCSNVPQPPTIQQTVDQLLALYRLDTETNSQELSPSLQGNVQKTRGLSDIRAL
jgi:glycosyltransferase involved in cell wall biosynthesis